MKLVITVIGCDRVGIIAGVSKILADNNINILSINQTILEGIFNMVMMCESGDDGSTLDVLQAQLKALAEELGVEILAQHAEIFISMHRVG